jgi:regulator of sigma E protease
MRLHGEMVEEGITNEKRAFLHKSKLVRSLVILAGVFMNMVLAVICFAIAYSFTGVPRVTKDIKVLDISADSPAISAGLLVGDVIKKADGTEFTKTEDFIKYVDTKRGKKVKIETSNGKKLTITPRENPPSGQGPLGVVISTSETYFPPVWQRPFYGIYYGFKEAYFWGGNIAGGLWSMVSGLAHGNVPKDVSGPVGIYAVTTEVAKTGLLSLINFIGILSVNLAILNVLPFPALDGGRLLFIVIEAILFFNSFLLGRHTRLDIVQIIS